MPEISGPDFRPEKKVATDHNLAAEIKLPENMRVRGATSGLSGLESTGSPVAWSDQDLIGLSAVQRSDEIVLVRGTGISVGQYANPIAVPAGTTAVSLGTIESARFDRSTLLPLMALLIGTKPEQLPQVQKAVNDWEPSKTKVYALLIPQVGGGYLRVELGDPTIPQVKLKFSAEGAIDLSVGGIQMISPSDGVFLHALYQPDLKRILSSHFIGVCAPQPVQQIEFLELGSLLLPVRAATDAWKAPQFLNQRTGADQDVSGSHAALEIPGTRTFVGKNNDWTYRFERSEEGGIDLKISSVNKKNEQVFYEMVAQGNHRPLIIPEPNPENRYDARKVIAELGKTAGIVPAAENTSVKTITGTVLYQASADGRILPIPERGSISNLKQLGNSAEIEGNKIVLRGSDNQKTKFTIVSLRDKGREGIDGQTSDAYAIADSALERFPELKERLFVGGVDDFDILAAHAAAKKAFM